MSLAVPLTHLAELADAEAALAAHVADRGELWASAPSALPRWTRAHVVAHLAGNARGMVNLTQWAASGTTTPIYPSPEERAPVNVCDLASTRIREVEIHRDDVADEHQAADWSPQFTLRTLDQAVPFFLAATNDGADVPAAPAWV